MVLFGDRMDATVYLVGANLSLFMAAQEMIGYSLVQSNHLQLLVQSLIYLELQGLS